MSQENVERLRQALDANRLLLQPLSGASEFDVEAAISVMAELWDPEIDWDASETPVLDISGVYSGTDAVRQWWRDWYGAWETLEFEYELVDAEDYIVVLLDLRMRGRSTGMEVAVGKFAFVNTFRDGLIVHTKIYMSQSEALEAVGLSEQDAHADS
jgi:ketosteroid isomerase-like protein